MVGEGVGERESVGEGVSSAKTLLLARSNSVHTHADRWSCIVFIV